MDNISTIHLDVVVLITEYLTITELVRLARTDKYFYYMLCIDDPGKIWRKRYRRDISEKRFPLHGNYLGEYRKVMIKCKNLGSFAMVYAGRYGYEKYCVNHSDEYKIYHQDLMKKAAMKAARKGYEDIIDLLLPHIYHRDDMTPYIHSAIKGGQLQLTRKLLSKFPLPLSSKTLENAVKSQNIEMVRYILGYPHKIDTFNEYFYRYALITAAEYGYLDILHEILCYHQPIFDVLINISTTAIEYNHIHVVQYLIDSKLLYVTAAFFEAIQYNRLEILNLIIDYAKVNHYIDAYIEGPNIHGHNTIHGISIQTMFECIKFIIKVGNFTILDICMELVSQSNRILDFVDVAVTSAIQVGNLDLLLKLLESPGYSLSVSRALDDACENGRLNIVKYLIDHFQISDYSMVKYAIRKAKENHPDVVIYLRSVKKSLE